MSIDVTEHRVKVNKLLILTSELVRAQVTKKQKDTRRRMDYLGAKLKEADLRGANLRGALLIAADLSNGILDGVISSVQILGKRISEGQILLAVSFLLRHK